MTKYQLRITEVNAVRFRLGLEDEWAHLWRDGVLVGRYRSKEAADTCPNKSSTGFFGHSVPVINTPTGRVTVQNGDWIITNPYGERTVVTSITFDHLYCVPANSGEPGDTLLTNND